MRLMTAAGCIALALVLFLLWLLSPVDPIPATYAANDCRKITVTDPRTGQPITGAEDLALAPDGDSLIFSAHDRRDPDRSDGGLYRVSLWGLGGASHYEAQSLVDPGAREVRFRPHGIAVSGDGLRLALINRVAEGEAVIEIGVLRDGRWELVQRLTGQTLCRANDLDFVGSDPEGLQITLDRRECTTALADLMPGSTTGSVVLWDGTDLRTLHEGLSFANGIEGPYVAETRNNRLWRTAGAPIRLPGGPDNITRQDRNHLLVAVHPRLRLLWLYLNDLWIGAPSRIVRVNVLTGAQEVLFDDPGGELFSAATSAVFANDMLIAGSVADDGLLICQRSGG